MRYVTVMLAALVALSAGCSEKPKKVEPAPQTARLEPARPAFRQAPRLRKVEPLEDYAPASAEEADPMAVARQPIRPAKTTRVSKPPVVQAPAAAPGGVRYSIRKKDTLWSLASRHMGSGQRWPQIAAANPGLDPHKLRIGATIVIPQP